MDDASSPKAHGLTKNQALVMDALSQAKAPLSAYTILDRLRDDGLRAPLQVYRALDKLLDRGLVHRLDSLNAFVACAHEHCTRERTVAFAICDACGRVSEFSDEEVDDRLEAWSRDNGFRLVRTAIEMHGSCSDCLAA